MSKNETERLRETIKFYRSFVKNNPNNAFGYCVLGTNDFELAKLTNKKLKYNHAKLNFSKAIRRDPENPEYLIKRSELYSTIAKYALAARDLTESGKYRTDDKKVEDLMTTIRRELLQQDGIRAEVQKLINSKTLTNEQVKFFTAEIELIRDKKSCAEVNEANKRAKAYTGSTENINKRMLEKEIVSLKKYIEYYRESVKNNPNNAFGYYVLGQKHFELAKLTNENSCYNNAKLCLNKAIMDDPENPEYLAMRSKFYSKFGSYALAAKDLTEFVKYETYNEIINYLMITTRRELLEQDDIRSEVQKLINSKTLTNEQVKFFTDEIELIRDKKSCAEVNEVRDLIDFSTNLTEDLIAEIVATGEADSGQLTKVCK